MASATRYWLLILIARGDEMTSDEDKKIYYRWTERLTMTAFLISLSLPSPFFLEVEVVFLTRSSLRLPPLDLVSPPCDIPVSDIRGHNTILCR